MRYIHFFGDNGYCGTDYHEFREFEDNTPDSEINSLSDELADDCAQTYSHLATGQGDTFESEDEEQEYYENAVSNCGWEELDRETWKQMKEDYS